MQFWTAIILGVADVIGFKRLEDGGTAQRTCGIVGPDVLAEDRRFGSCSGARISGLSNGSASLRDSHGLVDCWARLV